jgi:hypothetical protein
MTRCDNTSPVVQTQITIHPPRSYTWRADAARAIRITATLLLLVGWFLVVGLHEAAVVVRSAVIDPSQHA